MMPALLSVQGKVTVHMKVSERGMPMRYRVDRADGVAGGQDKRRASTHVWRSCSKYNSYRQPLAVTRMKVRSLSPSHQRVGGVPTTWNGGYKVAFTLPGEGHQPQHIALNRDVLVNRSAHCYLLSAPGLAHRRRNVIIKEIAGVTAPGSKRTPRIERMFCIDSNRLGERRQVPLLTTFIPTHAAVLQSPRCWTDPGAAAWIPRISDEADV